MLLETFLINQYRNSILIKEKILIKGGLTAAGQHSEQCLGLVESDCCDRVQTLDEKSSMLRVDNLLRFGEEGKGRP
jgi:hypothetical protein